jgi:tRNA(fMet)-specific endonuclease VapC
VYLLDTTVLVDLIRRRSERIERNIRAHARHPMGVSIITVCELRYGIEISAPSGRARNEQLLAEFLAPLDVYPLDEGVVTAYGHVRAALTRAGTPIGPLDTLIAAHAVTLDATLVTANVNEFQRVAGLRVEDWSR